MTSLSKTIRTTMTKSDCATFFACSATNTASTATKTTTLSCTATPVTKRDQGATGVPFARLARPDACEESLPAVIYPSNPRIVNGIAQILKELQEEKRAGGDTAFRYVTIDAPTLAFTAFYWVSALTESEMEEFKFLIGDEVRQRALINNRYGC